LRHIINNASGTLRPLVERLFQEHLTPRHFQELLTLIFYPAEVVGRLERTLRTPQQQKDYALRMLQELFGVVRLLAARHSIKDATRIFPTEYRELFTEILHAPLGLNFIYEAFTTSDLPSAIGGVRALGIRGCAISMPFKERCIEHLNELDASAKGILSVNTIVNTDGYLKGYNTDYTAVSKLIRSRGIPAHASFTSAVAVGWQKPLPALSGTRDLPMV
jgi:Firmicute fructose-1,6-bisphosphatase/Shikimate dehydrogenase substrate binding domain